MNFNDLQETVWRNLGYPDTTSGHRTDWRLQEIKDGLNTAYHEVAATCAPALNFLKRETTITLVAGTSDYLIDDHCQRPLSMWVEGVNAQPLEFKRAMEADRDGSRGTNNIVGEIAGYAVTLLPRTTTAAYSGVAGSTTGATATEGATFATLGSGVTLVAAMVGRTFKLNGEQEDYIVTAMNNTSKVLTVDKPIISRLRGDGTTLTGAGYAADTCRWEVGPAGRYKLRFLPSPTVTGTVYVRYMAYPRKLIGDSDTPELQEDMHHLLVEGTMERITQGKQALEWAQTYGQRFKERIAMLQKSDRDEYPSRTVPRVATLDDYVGRKQVGEDRRRYGWW